MKRYWQVVRDDWRMRVAVILVFFMVALYIFNLSSLPKQKPIIGVFTYALVPALFIAGAVNFIMVIIKARERVTKRKDVSKFER